jgi:hypothetical protein
MQMLVMEETSGGRLLQSFVCSCWGAKRTNVV